MERTDITDKKAACRFWDVTKYDHSYSSCFCPVYPINSLVYHIMHPFPLANILYFFGFTEFYVSF